MEARKITIISTKTQSKKVIMSEAETLGQLKADLDKEGIDYTDMDFIEGVSQTEPKTDEAILPKDIPYTSKVTGETRITNELVFMLTNTKKKIDSGMMSRSAMYTHIKQNNLKDKVKEVFGKDFTRVSNEQLENFICNVSGDTKALNNIDNLFKKVSFVLSEILEYLNKEKEAKKLNSAYNDDEIEQMFNKF